MMMSSLVEMSLLLAIFIFLPLATTTTAFALSTHGFLPKSRYSNDVITTPLSPKLRHTPILVISRYYAAHTYSSWFLCAHSARQQVDNNNNEGKYNNSNYGTREANEAKGIRLNKVFKSTHSRREADALIESGRVSVNGHVVHQKGGFKVKPFVDQIALDGVLIEDWEAMNGLVALSSSPRLEKKHHNHPAKSIARENASGKRASSFEYIKYWKPRGVTCTTDRSIESNIIDDLIKRRGYRPKHRVYPVGRLDKDTSGLILLTSDGRIPNSALRGQFKQPKVYQVLVNRPLDLDDVQRLREGVVITTVAQRDGGQNRVKALTAPTLPCLVERMPKTGQRGVQMTLVEGRNRQIRKMMQALGYQVEVLHRVEFMGIRLDPLQRAGQWKALDDGEMETVNRVLQRAQKTAATMESPSIASRP